MWSTSNRRRGFIDVAKLTWEAAIEKVLHEASKALHYSEIADIISNEGLRSVGATPAASVAATISRSISAGDSPYVRLGGGLYALRESLEGDENEAVSSLKPEEDSDTGALSAFGMFWRRSEVIWSGKPKLLGRQSLGATDVNFAAQVGVYLLHDRDRTIYVGRASDTLFARLKAHTTDRLSGRWDRFSWFGLRAVTEDGKLSEPAVAWDHSVVIETLEALLIESLEPPLNRKRGDNLAAIEYLQSDNPDLEKIKKKQMMQELMERAGLGD